MPTKIEYVDEVFNPVTGCTPISEGCAHCYAAAIAKRFWGKRPFSDVRCHPERLNDPFHWRKPRKILVPSMGDLFHEDAIWESSSLFEFQRIIISTMGAAPRHTFLILTKRPASMKSFFDEFGRNRTWPLKNVWLGVTVENQKAADERIPILLQIPAAVRWVSVEPMLEGIDFTLNDKCFLTGWYTTPGNSGCKTDGAKTWGEFQDEPIQHFDGPKLDWIVCGGESGPGARPLDINWARDLRDQCKVAGVPFYFKQLGAWKPCNSPLPNGYRLGSHRVHEWHCGYPGAPSPRFSIKVGNKNNPIPEDLQIREYPDA